MRDGSSTPEKGKASHCSGELWMRDQAMHPGKQEKVSHPEVSCGCEMGSSTLEKGKASHYSGE